MRKSAMAWAVAISSLATTALFAQETVAPPPADPAGETDILSYEKKGNLMAVPVTLAGQGPYAFLVDSGAERTFISQELVDKLALQRGKNVRVHSMTNAQTLSTARIPQLQFSRKRVSDIHAPLLPAAYIGAAGILGVDSLRRQRVEFDFKNRTMMVTPARAVEQQWARDAIVVTAKSIYGRLVLTDATIDGQKVLAIIDTGSDLSVGNRELQRRLTRKGRLRPTVPLEVSSVTGRRFMVDYTQAREMAVNNLTISNMPIGFADTHIFRQLRLQDRPVVMLGMDTLSLFAKISVDFARKEVRFQLPERRAGQTAPVNPASGLALATTP
jgi:predicted aspartyl protease